MPAYPPILPRPLHPTPREGQFTFNAQTALLADEATEGVAAFLGWHCRPNRKTWRILSGGYGLTFGGWMC